MKKERFFRVKYGFGSLDFVSIPEVQLEKAVFAHIRGTPVQLGDSFINGKNIIAITPDYHRVLGWNAVYDPKMPEDMLDIRRHESDYLNVVENCRSAVLELIRTNRTSLIGKPREEVKKLQ